MTSESQAVLLNAPPTSTKLTGRIGAGVRITIGCLWLANTEWKIPTSFNAVKSFTTNGTADAVSAFAPYTYIVKKLVLPNFGLFGWLTLLLELSLGAFLILGLGTRLWALIGAGQATAIGLSVMFQPGEWPWAYVMMVVCHLMIFSLAAGRTGGLDGVLRPLWHKRTTKISQLLMRAS